MLSVLPAAAARLSCVVSVVTLGYAVARGRGRAGGGRLVTALASVWSPDTEFSSHRGITKLWGDRLRI